MVDDMWENEDGECCMDPLTREDQDDFVNGEGERPVNPVTQKGYGINPATEKRYYNQIISSEDGSPHGDQIVNYGEASEDEDEEEVPPPPTEQPDDTPEGGEGDCVPASDGTGCPDENGDTGDSTNDNGTGGFGDDTDNTGGDETVEYDDTLCSAQGLDDINYIKDETTGECKMCNNGNDPENGNSAEPFETVNCINWPPDCPTGEYMNPDGVKNQFNYVDCAAIPACSIANPEMSPSTHFRPTTG